MNRFLRNLPPLSKAQWTVIFTLLVFAGVSLTVVLAAIAADIFYPGGIPAAAARAIKLTPEITDAEFASSTASSTPTPFIPLPTHTITATPTKTASPTPSTTPTATFTATPPPTSTPPPPEPIYPADSVMVSNITGFPQSYNLSCESRSAVDWARYFGLNIGETDFLNSLPPSDDPNRGFVGSVYDLPGQIPPNGYGVHADPVAALLRSYGLSAEAVYGMTEEGIRHEINQGEPVIAWVVSNVLPGYGVDYTTQAGDQVIVAPGEHTVIVIGYDPYGVTVLDGAMVYWRSWTAFMDSFKVLGQMAVIYP